MVSLPLTFTPAAGRAFAATATKSASGSTEEKGLLDWLSGVSAKEDQLLEVDPILKKVERKGITGTVSKTGTVEVPQKKKNGGFGGLFVKQ